MPAMQASIAAGRITAMQKANTIADGISVARVGEHTFPVVQRCVDQIVTVTEEEIASAIMVLLEKEKTLAEGAGVVGFAALYCHRVDAIAERRVAAVISGGNIDMTTLSKILERGLEKDGRLTRLKVVAPDRAASLAEITAIVARQGANILHIAQSRPFADVSLGETELELMLETRDTDHAQAIRRVLAEETFRVE